MLTQLSYKSVVIFTVCLIMAVMLVSVPAAAQSKKMVMVGVRPPDSSTGKRLILIYTEAFSRLGLELVYRHYPGKRATAMVEQGSADGDTQRSSAYLDSVKHQVRVEEPINDYVTAAYSTDPSLKVDGWKSLKGTSYKVNYVRGRKSTSDSLTAVLPPEQVEAVGKSRQGLKKLEAGRCDLLIGVESQIDGQLDDEEFRNSGIVKVGIVSKTNLHTYLHKKHKDLALKLAEVLKTMKKEGLIDKYEKMTKDNE